MGATLNFDVLGADVEDIQYRNTSNNADVHRLVTSLRKLCVSSTCDYLIGEKEYTYRDGSRLLVTQFDIIAYRST